MNEIPEHLLRRAQRASNIVRNGNWTTILFPADCTACGRAARWRATKLTDEDSEYLCDPCHSNLTKEHQ